jgi:hypothetical protein
MRISERIHAAWREVEDILTAATGPILIAASALAAADIFSNHVFSNQYPWIPAAWAAARALAVTIWLGIAWEFYLTGRERGAGGWWLILALALFGVDLQTALLFAIQDEHLATVGSIPLVTIPAVYWAFEQAVLGVVLIAVHRSIDHNTQQTRHAETQVTVRQPARLNLQATPPDVVIERPAPVARRAYLASQPAPITTEEDAEAGMTLEFVTDEQEAAEPGLSRQSRTRTQARKRRRDAGSRGGAAEDRVTRLLGELRVRPAMTIDDVEEFLNVSRGTAVQDRREARRRLDAESASKRPHKRPQQRPPSEV